MTSWRFSRILTEELAKNSLAESKWTTGASQFSTSFNYFDGHALWNTTIWPINALPKYVSEDVIKLIVDQTNIYGKQRCLKKGEDGTNWNEIDQNQMKAFLSIIFIMGFHELPRIRDYWIQGRNLFTSAVANTMTRNDFQWVLGHIHLADNT